MVIGPLELALLVALVLLITGNWWVPKLAHRVGEVVGTAERSDEEFRRGRKQR